MEKVIHKLKKKIDFLVEKHNVSVDDLYKLSSWIPENEHKKWRFNVNHWGGDKLQIQIKICKTKRFFNFLNHINGQRKFND